MANLKIDLQNKLRNDKYYEELELVRLANEPNMMYREKIERMSHTLRELSLLDAQLNLTDKYFQEDPVEHQQQKPQNQEQQNVVHQGQTHGE